jgi:hypothetical protein
MDGLDYIREALKKTGRKAVVEVTRWEIDPVTGMRDKAFKVIVPAFLALKELEKPMHKRGRAWQMIRPIGYVSGDVQQSKVTFNSLSDPALRQSIIDEAKAQLLEEMKASEEKPKAKKKKSSEEDEMLGLGDNTSNQMNDIEPSI